MAGFGLDQTILFETFVTFTQQFAPDALDAIRLEAAVDVVQLDVPEEANQAVEDLRDDFMPLSGL